MTQAKVKELKGAYNKEFSLIYQLCDFILRSSGKPSLINATLETLLRFLNWIPIGFIFQTKMIELLLFKVRLVFIISAISIATNLPRPLCPF
jgi:exportin-1